MSMIQLNDGTQAFILNSRDLVDIAYNKLGSEYSDQIESVIQLSTEAEIYAEKRYNSDMISYEGTIESYRNTILEVMEIAEKLEESIEDSKRLNREEILKDIRLIVKKLNNEL
jgi:hypothetical protein